MRTSGREAALLVEEAGAEALFVRIDAREPGDLRAMVDAAVDRFGGLDVLHNNVGVLEANFTDQLTVDVLPEDVWETVYQINLRSYFLTTKYAAPHLKASSKGPAIVNTASVSGLVAYPIGPGVRGDEGRGDPTHQGHGRRSGPDGALQLLLPRRDRRRR